MSHDENGESDSISVTINITNDPSDDTPNNPPMFTDGDSTTRSIAENMLREVQKSAPQYPRLNLTTKLKTLMK